MSRSPIANSKCWSARLRSSARIRGDIIPFAGIYAIATSLLPHYVDDRTVGQYSRRSSRSNELLSRIAPLRRQRVIEMKGIRDQEIDAMRGLVHYESLTGRWRKGWWQTRGRNHGTLYISARVETAGNLVKAQVHRLWATHDSSCRYIRDGYYLQQLVAADVVAAAASKPITIAVAFSVFVLPLPVLFSSSSCSFLHALVLSLNDGHDNEDDKDDNDDALYPTVFISISSPTCPSDRKTRLLLGQR